MAPPVSAAPSVGLDQLIHESWGARDGLPAGRVRAIAQTPDGFVWIGTSAGLARFDGRHFTVYRRGAVPALRTDDIAALHVDGGGRLWIGTYGDGVVVLERGRFRALRRHVVLPHRTITAISGDADGGVWIGTIAGLVHVRGGRSRVYRGPAGTPLYITSITDSRDGVLCTTLGGGVLRVTPRGLAPVQGLAGPALNARRIARVGDGYWIATHGAGLHTWDGAGAATASALGRALPDPVLRDIAVDATGATWIASYGGISRVRGGGVETMTPRDGLSGGLALTVFRDDLGHVWVGTDRGLDRFRPPSIAHLSTGQGLGNPRVHALVRTRAGRIYAGSEGGGLSEVSGGRAVRTWGVRDGLSSAYVVALAEDRSGALWLGTIGNGVDRMTADGIEHFPPGKALVGIGDIAQAPDGSVWFATLGGIAVHRGGRIEAPPRPLQQLPARPSRLLFAPDGTLWIGTDAGLFRYDAGRLAPVPLERDGAEAAVQGIHLDGSAIAWVGTTRGLRAVDAGGVRAWRARAELERSIHHVLEDATGMLWLATDMGLVRVPRRGLLADPTGARVDLLVLDEGHGLRSPLLYTGVLGADGLPMFGTDDGIAQVLAGTPTWPRAPEAIVERAVVGAATLADPARIRVDPGAKEVAIEFTATRFAPAGDHRLQYRLRGLDAGWVDAGDSRSVRYANLAPDGYVFEVRVIDRSARVLDETAVPLEVLPHWYQATGARLAFLAAAIGLALLLHLARTRHLARREAALQALVGERTDALAIANQALAARFQDEQRRADRFVMNARVASIMTAAPEEDALLGSVLDAIRMHLGYDEAEIATVCGPDRDVLVGRRLRRTRSGVAAVPTRWRVGEGVVGRAAQTRAVERAGRVDPARDAATQGPVAASRLFEVAIPIVYDHALEGVLAVAASEAFSEIDIVSLEIVAENLAVALSNARLLEQGRRLVVVEERQRLARNLHDNVTQILSSISLIAQSLPAALEHEPGEARRRADRLSELAQLGFGEMRALLNELSPRVSAGPAPATRIDALSVVLGRLLRAMVPPSIRLQLEIDHCAGLPAAVEEAVLRVCQEAVSNACRHAGATRITVVVRDAAAAVELCVSDDGRGLPAVRRPGMGLDNMRRRVADLGGTLEIDSGPHGGTAVRAVLPRTPSR